MARRAVGAFSPRASASRWSRRVRRGWRRGAGVEDQGYIVLTLGVESRPGSGGGWFVEGGVGGGVRLAGGYRWRLFK